MARRSAFTSALAELQRQQNAAARRQAQAVTAAGRARVRAERAAVRLQIADEKERLRAYVADCEHEAEELTHDARMAVERLKGILAAALNRGPLVSFDALRHIADPTPFAPGPLAVPTPAVDPNAFVAAPLEGMKRLVPGAKERHAGAVAQLREHYAAALAHRDELERDRQARLHAAEAAHRKYLDEHATYRKNHEDGVNQLQEAVLRGDPDALLTFYTLVFEASVYPDGFPHRLRLAYVPQSKQLVIEFELPPASIVPAARQYKYVKASDTITETARPATQIRALYVSLVAQITLRTLHEAFANEPGGLIETVVFNGMIDAVEPATGKSIRPCLVTVRATRDVFAEIDLLRADPAACLKHLSASVSKSPTELAPVRPVLEFDMVDPRFVQESDVLGTLDQRPNLMELTPSEFESLITNLFTRMGLQTKMTQASRDGGVDCVAYDQRPILGGKVVIQAKRYKGTVGVSAVRDLYGTLHNEGASKGILVTTSGYGKASFDFANGKPMELIDGAQLLYLLAEHAGIEAKIEPPDDWVDPLDAATQ